MNSYMYLDHSGKTLKKICRKIIRRMAVSFSSCIDSKLDYIGMGSLFYEDFKEFYPSGCIDGMTSIECMTDGEGIFDEMKYRRFMLNRPYEQIRIIPELVSEAIKQLPFDKPFLVWFDYDCAVTRETIEDTAEVIRKASAPGMIANSTGNRAPFQYLDEKRELDMDIIRSVFSDILVDETSAVFDDINKINFTDCIRDAVASYYQKVVSEKNEKEHRNYRLIKAERIEHRQPLRFVTDIWLLVDEDETDIKSINEKVLRPENAESYCIDMVVLTEREKSIIGSRLGDDPEMLAEELAIDTDSVRKYIRYWEDFTEKSK